MVPNWDWYVGSRWGNAMKRPIQDSRDLFRCIVAPIGLIGIIHIVGGISILIDPEASHVTALDGLNALPPLPTALVLLLVGALAVAARSSLVPRSWEKPCIIPQQMVLLVQLMGVIGAIYAGRYPNGHMPIEGDYLASAAFILSDQLPWIMLCLSHTVELVFADCLLARVRNYYEAQLEQEHSALMQAEKLLAMQNETKFWLTLNGEPR
jgi:hypothetical protein